MDEAVLLAALLRDNLPAFMEWVFSILEPGTTFLPNWHYEHLCWHLMRVMRGESRRLIINVPPRSGKSLLGSVAWPMFVLGHDPTKRVICVSHTEDLARKFSVDRRTIAQNGRFRELFPRFRLAQARDLELSTTRRGSCFAAGVTGRVLGRGADLIIIDDPIKGIAALSQAERRRVAESYDNTLVTRLNDKQTGAIVIIMQRLHEDDLVGHVLDRDEWDVVSLPAIAVEEGAYRLSDAPRDIHHCAPGELLHEAREPRAVLEGVRRAQGSLLFNAQYQQSPVPPGGNVIKRDWLRSFDEEPEAFDRIIVSWDTASTIGDENDWSVGTVWGAVGLDYYLLDVVREKLESPDLRRSIIRLSEHYEADATLIEDTELGRALQQDLRQTNRLRPILQRPRFDKEARLLAQAPRFEAGQVHLPREAPWLATYVSELLAFPQGKHDDQVDSTSQALRYLTGKTPVDRPMIRRDVTRRDVVRR